MDGIITDIRKLQHIRLRGRYIEDGSEREVLQALGRMAIGIYLRGRVQYPGK